MEFENIPRNELSRLSVSNSRLVVSPENAERMKVLGVIWKNGDYSIFDYGYYDVLKKYGYRPSLHNMIRLHNFILETL